MKEKLRLLCLGLAAAAMTTGFAQENVTSKYLKNSSFESGVRFWDVEFESQVWGKNESKSKQAAGFYGFSGTSLEVWNGSVLKPNSVTQTINNLPNGTYVFGAYVGASFNLSTPAQPTKAEGMTTEEFKATDEYKEWKAEYDAIRAKFVTDSVFGVKMFANLDSIPVATEYPDRAEEKRHTVKFNVATQVTDGKLTVGLDVDSTNCVYVCWDEAELYSFGNMSPEEALNAMAKIDAQKPVLVADTVKGKYMNADTLAYLNEGYAAIAAVTTPAEFAAADEKLRWGVVLANRSANDYTKLANKIAKVKADKDSMLVKIEGEWLYPWYVAATENVLAQAQAAYDGKAANRAEINELVDSLTLSYAELQFEELDYVVWKLGEFLNEHCNNFGDGVGQYPITWLDSLNRLYNRANEVVRNFSRETALEDVKMIAEVENSIVACLASANGPHGTPFVTQVLTGDPALGEQGDGAFIYKSDTYNAGGRLESVKISFLTAHCPNGSSPNKGGDTPHYVALSEFYVYDANGNAITLTADCFSSNASDEAEGKDFGALCDNKNGTFWHSDWHGRVTETHYLEVRIPDGTDLNKFAIGWRSRNANQNIPASIELSATVSGADYNPLLNQLAADVKSAYDFLKVNLKGTAVGFCDVDFTALNQALAAAEELLAREEAAADADYQAAIDAIKTAKDAIEAAGVVLPVAGKEYRIISAGMFFDKQGINKALTSRNDTLWWETAGPDSARQVFKFTPIPNEDGANYYALQNVATGLYLNTPEEGDYAPFFEMIDTVEVFSIGKGQFGLKNHPTGVMHACDHNSGNTGNGWTSTPYSPAGGLWGNYSLVVPYGEAEADGHSAWYICEMNVLPLTALTDTKYFLYEGVSVVSFVADKATDFEDFAVYGIDGQFIEAELEQMGNTMLVTLPEAVWSFSYSFNNKEGVTVTVDKSNLNELRAAYDEAVALAPEEGKDVGQYSDLSDYNKALADAEELLKRGATDAEVEAAIKAIEDAVAALVPNMPVAGKTYYIINAYEVFEQNHDAPMAIYAKQTMTYGVAKSYAQWSYISSKPAFHWRFIEAETRVASSAEQKDTTLYYIQNVATEEYAMPISRSTTLELTKDQSEAGLYSVDFISGTSAAISLNGKKGSYDDVSLHCGGHKAGAGRAGNIVGWGSSAVVSQWKICEAGQDISISVLVGATGSATYCSAYALDFSTVEGLKAYAATGYNNITGVVTLTRVMTSQPGEGLFIKGEPGEYKVPLLESTGDNTLNMLVGTLESTSVNALSDDGLYANYKYTIKEGDSVPLFYPFADGSTLGTGKAYLRIPTAWLPSTGARSISYRFDEGEGTTDIEEQELSISNSQQSIVYDLYGRKVENPVKGSIYIVNGKKIIY